MNGRSERPLRDRPRRVPQVRPAQPTGPRRIKEDGAPVMGDAGAVVRSCRIGPALHRLRRPSGRALQDLAAAAVGIALRPDDHLAALRIVIGGHRLVQLRTVEQRHRDRALPTSRGSSGHVDIPRVAAAVSQEIQPVAPHDGRTCLARRRVYRRRQALRRSEGGTSAAAARDIEVEIAGAVRREVKLAPIARQADAAIDRAGGDRPCRSGPRLDQRWRAPFAVTRQGEGRKRACGQGGGGNCCALSQLAI